MTERRYPIGAEATADGTHFRVWALGRRAVSLIVEGHPAIPMEATGDGYFSVLVPDIRPGTRYRFQLDGGEPLPDPASRWQPEGPEGPSVVTDNIFAWSDAYWRGVPPDGQVLYEIHIGTFTPEGTWAAATERLQTLRDLGITVLQVMPIGEFNGAFGWGYDTVLPYAPSHLYGPPDDLHRFIDRAHALGLGVILDVVYNHAGLGDHFKDFTPHYFSTSHHGEWGAIFNFDGEGATGVREFMVQNAVYWVREFHFDGLRLDATQALFDDSDTHIIAEIAAAARAAAPERQLFIVAENQPQDHRLVDRPEAGGYGLEAIGNDDFHHAARVALTGHNDFYYRDYHGTSSELLASAKYGFLYQGQRSDMRDKPYGTPSLNLKPTNFVHFLENHDQVANSARGLRMDRLGSPGAVRAITALFLLSPQTPCLFHGQEFGASTRFLYFAGFTGETAAAIAKGRTQNLRQFAGVSDPAMDERLADPADPATFAASKLDWSEFERHGEIVALHRDLLRLRRSETAFTQQGQGARLDGAVLGEQAFFLRYLSEDGDDRLLFINLGRDRHMAIIPDPLVAPPAGRHWESIWSSEHPDYGGSGRYASDMSKFWILPGHSALLFAAIDMKARIAASLISSIRRSVQ
ncbi:MAG: putative 1,4-alpha-glucan branching enzyme protein [Devosia sp.]|uniref:malto-oligosyltrehalose trehalohydrolase n=1 Tax=Devosia sp. TaxID=1871048 RepID=UPI0026393F77|nr:malto-oligosyltrehalose trehalohydrolase [Devosia sp.]MDB5527818.1 putative 1,4-alpha-glucan branching enzyme protein [Devosia sp.]